MAKSLHQQISFTAGELSPRLDARVDSSKYGVGLRECLNMIPYKTGALTRRPGTQYIAAAKLTNTPGHNYAVRNMAFIFSPETTFNLEFGNNYIRFYSNGVQVEVASADAWVSGKYYYPGNYVTDPTDLLIYLRRNEGSGSIQPHLNPIDYTQQTILEIPNTPYGADALTGSIYETDIWRLSICQINDVVYIVSPDYRPYKLTRITDTEWDFGVVNYLYPALLDQNGTDTIITPSAVQGGGITLTASAPAWIVAHSYDTSNTVQDSGTIYQCIVAHVSLGTFATGLAAGYWEAITIFNPGIAASTWQLATLRNSGSVEYDGDATTGFAAGSSSTLQVRGPWELHTYGVWSATIAVERSLDQGVTWESVRTVTGRFDRNVDIEGNALELGWYRITVSEVDSPASPGPTDPRVVLECVDAFLYGLVEITAYVSAYVAVGSVVQQLADPNPIAPQWVSGQAYSAADEASYNFINYTATMSVTSSVSPSLDVTHWSPTAPGGTQYWSEAAWSGFRGYPQAITAFQQRVVYGGSEYEPQRIWGTVTNDLENFALGDQTLATDSFAFDLNAVGRGRIQWLLGQINLFTGFSGAEWVVTSGSTNQSGGGSGSAITATNVNAVEHSTWGSAPHVAPATVGDSLMFTQRQATTLRQMLFSVYTEKYMSQDLTTLSDHLFASGIAQIAYQSRWKKQSLFWAVTRQGTLVAMTYELDQEVFGWHRHQTGYGQFTGATPPVAIPPDNGFESVAVLPGQGTADDQVYVVANRLIDGVQTRYIERLNPVNWEEVFAGAPTPPAPVLADAFYVDCGKTYLNPVSTQIPSLTHLEHRWVVGLVDGNAFGPIQVSGGVIQLPAQFELPIAVVQVGLPIRYRGQPMRIDQDPRAGNTQGLIKTQSDLYIRVLNAAGGLISNGTDEVGINQPVPIPYTPTVSSTATRVLVTEPTDIRVTPKLMPVNDEDPQIIVTGNDALPITVLALIRKVDIVSVP